MNWQDLTAPDFAKAVQDVQGVCVLPVSVIEKHGEHLPLGTDMFGGQAQRVRQVGLPEPAEGRPVHVG